ncbi:MAG: hypothetical protein HXY36_06405 [Chloroflexi bacterium]|nr:hypothetical protein [Chloroflexota bacterium]NWF78202.1 hypothetical protein [Chloroflexota bacterium]
MTKRTATKNKSFMLRYRPRFDQERDEWILQIPAGAVIRKSADFYEVRLPVYASRALAIGGNILRPLRKKYRDWLLTEQHGLCAICSKPAEPSNPWNLDHQPALAESGSKFIDYEKVTQNRVIHRNCDPSQTSKRHE